MFSKQPDEKVLLHFHTTSLSLNLIKMYGKKKNSLHHFLPIFPVICSRLPITRTFFDFPWRFQLPGVGSKYYYTCTLNIHRRKCTQHRCAVCSWSGGQVILAMKRKEIFLALHHYWKAKELLLNVPVLGLGYTVPPWKGCMGSNQMSV